MRAFSYLKATSVDQALHVKAAQARFLAGGTTLVDLMKLEVETPPQLVDLKALPLAQIEAQRGGGVRIGAMVRNSDLAHDERIAKDYPVLAQAILAGASPQLRNRATTGGNLLQRTRCVYFRDVAKACNKRQPGSGCAALEGFHRNLAILGTSSSCIATNPSDMNVAMAALEASVHLYSKQGERTVALADFHLLPGKTPEVETVLTPGEMITGVTLAPLPPGTRSLYLKLRDRASYEFALASAAVVATVDKGRIARIRIAMGGIGTKPWRSPAAEQALEGGSPSEEQFKKAAELLLAGAEPRPQNRFKVELARRCLIHTLQQATQA